MNIHPCARSCPRSRELLVHRIVVEGWSAVDAATAAGLSERSAYKWLRRYREEGVDGLRDRSSRPLRSPRRVPDAAVERMLELRRKRRTAAEIAKTVRRPRSTVARWLKRRGLGRLRFLAPPEPVRRYEHTKPGSMLHLDVKKLGKFTGVGHRITGARTHTTGGRGWEYVHVCIDDYSRVAYLEVLEDETGETTTSFLRRAQAWFAARGVRVRRVLTDNGPPYLSRVFAAACDQLGIKRSRTRPYRPQTNGKAERFIQTMLRECAYGREYSSSAYRRQGLAHWLRRYNEARPHGSLGGKPPITRLPA